MGKRIARVYCIEGDGILVRPIKYYKVMDDPSEKDISYMALRSLYNGNLDYYVTIVEGDEEMTLALLKNKETRKKYFYEIK